MNTYPSSIVRAGTEALIGGGYGKRIWSVGELLWGIEELVILSNQHEIIIGIGEGELWKWVRTDNICEFLI